MATYRIDDLAQAAGTTVRNVRHYQDKGLLPAPERKGRVGFYDESHLARLRLIGQLQERGYNLATIADLIPAWERGHNVTDLLGLEKVLTDPWTDETPGYLTLTELVELFGAGVEPDELGHFQERAEEFGFVQRDGERYKIPSPRLLHVGAEMVAAGIPLEKVFEITALVRDDCETIAQRFVQLVVDHMRLDDPELAATRDDLPEVVTFVQRMRPLARLAVEGLLARAMQAQIQTRLSNAVAAVAERSRPHE